MKVYTRRGDAGLTSLIEGKQISKADLRLHAYGTVDELNSFLGVLHARLVQLQKKKSKIVTPMLNDLEWIQDSLFVVGSLLATAEDSMRAKLPQLPKDAGTRLEQSIDTMSTKLPPLKNFVLPGQDETAAWAHIARTVCRRAERWVVALSEKDPQQFSDLIVFLNRLSDYFFVLSRYLLVAVAKKKDHLWRPEKL